MILPLWFDAAAVAVCPGLVGVDSPTDRDRLARPLAPNAADPRAVVPTAYFKKRKKKQVTILFESHQNRQESEIVYT